MKFRFSFLVFVSALLFACTAPAPKNNIPVVGELDSSIIAMDTMMQKGFESSYEFHKTLVVHEKLVYDVVGWGQEYATGELAIIQRGADNKPDTVVKTIRDGIIEDAVLQHLGSGKSKEEAQVFLVMRQPGTGVYGSILAFSTPSFQPIVWSEELPKEIESQYMGHDSFYFEKKHLLREFPLYKKGDANCCPTGGRTRLTYSLQHSSLRWTASEKIK